MSFAKPVRLTRSPGTDPVGVDKWNLDAQASVDEEVGRAVDAAKDILGSIQGIVAKAVNEAIALAVTEEAYATIERDPLRVSVHLPFDDGRGSTMWSFSLDELIESEIVDTDADGLRALAVGLDRLTRKVAAALAE